MNDIATKPTAIISTAEIARRGEALRQADAISRIAAQGRDPSTDKILADFTQGRTDSEGVIERLKAHYGLG
jgi:hypothetical protein